MEYDLSFSGIFKILRKRGWLFLIVGILAIVLSGIFSGPSFITPKFRSDCVVYPVNLNSYSIESRTEQLLQLFESNSIRDSLILKFNLSKDYDIDTAVVGWRFALYNEFNDRVDIGKTRYESVRIEILDEDPDQAQQLVVEMLDQIDQLARRLQREKTEEILKIAERSMSHERLKMDSIESKLHNLRQETGLLEYDLQTEEVTKGYVRALSRPGTTEREKDELKKMLEELERSGGEFRALTHLGNMSRNEYNRLVLEYERVINDLTKELTYTNIIIHPEAADRKIYPIRWLVVLISLASALLFTFVIVAMKEYYAKG